ncbi:hypothetical protein COCCU_09355 [Corynebacterium occultum]|uniref:HEAT repeat protein n=1 Tax=Corynebacterium occultum TaxID=2675219 RepID=A0A6B8W951_9CORY|nr:HEAT repeat domain-containing protein [Corynebacterium occultum]QGU07795.1 hypothetical protein COCCU_09355 [Corynebacterium occultum]
MADMNTEKLNQALSATDASIRLRAALTAGTHPDLALPEVLLERCAVEPDFFVRDMLTWAITRLPTELTFPALVAQLADSRPQARSQHLHTLSKLREPATWQALPLALLHDPEVEVARAAWRCALRVVPAEEQPRLARELLGELGRGTPEIQRSLSRALAELADEVTALLHQVDTPDAAVAAHARATLHLIEDPESDFLADLAAAQRVAVLGSAQEN